MTSQIQQANELKDLHIKGSPLILFNVWDAGSARVVQEMGSKVIATSSWSVAAAHGYEDGEKLSLGLVLENLKRIIATVNLPVTIDLEGAYGASPTKVKETITKTIQAGAAGINFEDQIVGQKGLFSIEDQCIRIKTAREAAKLASVPIFINARTDIFFKDNPPSQLDSLLDEAIHRAIAYAEAGADGFFTPGLRTAKHIQKLCKMSPLPINIMVLPDTPSPIQLAELGVARISYGPSPYCNAMDALKKLVGRLF